MARSSYFDRELLGADFLATTCFADDFLEAAFLGADFLGAAFLGAADCVTAGFFAEDFAVALF